MKDRADIKLYNRDCVEAMREMPDKAFDLAIVDPPYGDLVVRGGYMTGGVTGVAAPRKYSHKIWEMAAPGKEYFEQLFRVSKNQIIWGGNYFIDSLRPSACWIVWDKQNTGRYADGELAWTSFKTALRIFKYTWNGMIQDDMANKEVRIHPTQKPVALYKWLLSDYAKEGDKILDTHLGSGSVAIACWDMKFDLTAFELDPDYCKGAMDRIEAHKRQGQFL